MSNPQDVMASMFNKILLNSDKIKFTTVDPILVEQDEQSKEARAAANKKMQEELEEMEKQLMNMKKEFNLEGPEITVYPNRTNLLEDYIYYFTLQSKITVTRNVLRIRLLPLENRMKEVGAIMASIKQEEKTGEAMEKVLNMFSDGNRFEKLLKEIKEEKDDKKDEPVFSRRLNKKDPKIEVNVTKTDKRAVFSLAIQEDEEDIQEAEEEDRDKQEEKEDE